jgi:hypothetical protein
MSREATILLVDDAMMDVALTLNVSALAARDELAP